MRKAQDGKKKKEESSSTHGSFMLPVEYEFDARFDNKIDSDEKIEATDMSSILYLLSRDVDTAWDIVYDIRRQLEILSKKFIEETKDIPVKETKDSPTKFIDNIDSLQSISSDLQEVIGALKFLKSIAAKVI